MSMSFSEFRQHTRAAVGDNHLQVALDNATGNFRKMRNHAFTALSDSDQLRDHFKLIRSATLGRLAHHLSTFESNAAAARAKVHWARDGAEACDIVVNIARQREVTLATKSKSMVTEEIHLNEALENAGVEVVETDLGEWIIQLAHEHPSHIIAPAIHKSRHEVAALLSQKAGRPLSPDNLPQLTAEARRILRQYFLTSGIGISGGNLAVAETGSLVLVTNEGNGRLVTSLPATHVAIIGIEKIVPTWDEAAVWLSLLARSASGQPLSVYTSIITGPAREKDADGPREVHIVLLDNGRSQLVGTKYEELLQCIRCGACLNVCPVYREIGGHAYGSAYSGPIGAVVTPLLAGLQNYEALPHASSLCDACKDACPVRIDLPRMLIELRNDEVDNHVLPWWQRMAEKAAAAIMRHEKSMDLVTGAIRLAQKPFVRDGALKFPRRLHAAFGRQMPGLAKRSFREMWQSGTLEDKR